MRATAALLVLVMVSSLHAQDRLKTTKGERLRGEVLEETDEAYRFVDRMGVLHVVKKTDVESLKRGKPLSKRVQRKLEGVDASSAEQLFGVVKWAAESRSGKRDAERLARRVLVLDPDHAEARKLLGHVRAFETWYPDAEEAKKAVAASMKARGYVNVRGGWINEIRKDDLESAPDRYMLVDGFEWRLITEVMAERGLTPWKGEWYPEEQKPLLEECARVLERCGHVVHVAEEGACRVYCHLGRKTAQEAAADVAKARAWYVETFDVNVDRRPIDREPVAVNYVLEDQAALEKFVESYSDLGFDPAALALSLPRKHANWPGFGFAIHTGEMLWRQHMVSQMGGKMVNEDWASEFLLPAWIWTACAHHAEIAVYGRAQVQYVAPDRYGRTSSVPLHAVTDIDGWKELMADALKDGDVTPLRRFFHKDFNELTATDDIMGVTFIAWMLETRKEAWKAFVRRDGKTIDTHFPKHIGSWAEIEHQFREWVKAPASKKK